MDDPPFLWIGTDNDFDWIRFIDFLFFYSYRSLKLFEKTINKPARVDLVPIRITEQLRLEQMDAHFEKYVYQKNYDLIIFI